MLDINYGMLALSLWVEMCIISFVMFWWYIPTMPIAAFALMFFPDLQTWVYTIIYKEEWIFWTQDTRRAKIGTWWLRNFLYEFVSIDIWQPNNLGVMYFLFWLM